MRTDVFVVNVYAVGCQPFQSLERLLFLVVEATVEAKVLRDELQSVRSSANVYE